METLREWEARWLAEDPDLEVRKAECRVRDKLAQDYLRPRLKKGDKLRAIKAECGAKEANYKFSHWDGDWIMTTGNASIAPGMVYSVNGDVLRFDAAAQNPPEFEALTEDMPLSSAFRAQRAGARAMGNDAEAAHLEFKQCEALAYMVRKNAEVPVAALLKQLEISGMACALPEHCTLFLLDIYRATLAAGDRLIAAQIALNEAAAAGDPKPPKIPLEDSTLQLVDEPMALTETAKRMAAQTSS